MDPDNPTQETAIEAPLENPNQLLHRLLEENNLNLTVTALSDSNPFIENTGFVLTDKPLLVVTASYKEETV